MRISIPLALFTLAAGAVLVVRPPLARAAVPPTSVNTPPSGPGTEQVTRTGRREGITPGWEASGGIGSGIAGTYAFGLEARLGYTLPLLPVGLYLGADAQAFWGNTAVDQQAHATFLGGEVGVKTYPLPWAPLRAVELRPYVFLGPAFVSQVSADRAGDRSTTALGVQPGVLAAYHLGNAFAGADVRLMANPQPVSTAIMASGGWGF
jgi:hypothetical protein